MEKYLPRHNNTERAAKSHSYLQELQGNFIVPICIHWHCRLAVVCVQLVYLLAYIHTKNTNIFYMGNVGNVPVCHYIAYGVISVMTRVSNPG